MISSFKVESCDFESNIELKSKDDIEKLYQCLLSEENFLLEWEDEDDDSINSQLFLSSELLGKVKTGGIIITSKEFKE